MKRLYHCSAHYDGNGLISYETRVIKIYKSHSYRVELYNYRSNTTLQHIRKYMRLLEEDRQFELANIIKVLYYVAGKHKDKEYIIYDFDGSVFVK